MKVRIVMIALTLAAVPISFVAAPYPEQLVLQHVPTLIGLTILLVVTVRRRPSRLSLTCCLIFLWLHIIGARWIYSFVPYDDAMIAVTGQSISQWFGWQRNHYDRLVHLASGVLGVAPCSEWLQRACRMSPAAAAMNSIAFVLAIGAIYEIFEWQIAVNLAPNTAEAYNGQQGDVWDPQKDLALAWLGACLAAIVLCRWRPAQCSAMDSAGSMNQ